MAEESNASLLKTPVQLLNEYGTKAGEEPTYEFDTVGDPSAPSFTCKVTVGRAAAVGEGQSKKAAKQHAAILVWETLQQEQISLPPVSKAKPAAAPTDGLNNPVMALHVLCLKRRLDQPQYELIDERGPAHQKKFKFSCRVGDIVDTDVAASKKLAKQAVAAKVMLQIKKAPPKRFRGRRSNSPPDFRKLDRRAREKQYLGEEKYETIHSARRLYSNGQEQYKMTMHDAAHLSGNVQEQYRMTMRDAAHHSGNGQEPYKRTMRDAAHLSGNSQDQYKMTMRDAAHLSGNSQDQYKMTMRDAAHFSGIGQEPYKMTMRDAAHLSGIGQEPYKRTMRDAAHLSGIGQEKHKMMRDAAHLSGTGEEKYKMPMDGAAHNSGRDLGPRHDGDDKSKRFSIYDGDKPIKFSIFNADKSKKFSIFDADKPKKFSIFDADKPKKFSIYDADKPADKPKQFSIYDADKPADQPKKFSIYDADKTQKFSIYDADKPQKFSIYDADKPQKFSIYDAGNHSDSDSDDGPIQYKTCIPPSMHDFQSRNDSNSRFRATDDYLDDGPIQYKTCKPSSMYDFQSRNDPNYRFRAIDDYKLAPRSRSRSPSRNFPDNQYHGDEAYITALVHNAQSRQSQVPDYRRVEMYNKAQVHYADDQFRPTRSYR